MIFQFRDSTFCVGKWASSVDVKKDECTLEAIVAGSTIVAGITKDGCIDDRPAFSKMRTVPFTDKDGLPIKLKAGAHELLNSAVRKHWSHIDLSEYQK